MTASQISAASSTQTIHEFLATCDGSDADDRWIAMLIYGARRSLLFPIRRVAMHVERTRT